MYFFQRVIVSILFFCHSLLVMAMTHEYHRQVPEWPASGVVAMVLALLFMAVVWGHGNEKL